MIQHWSKNTNQKHATKKCFEVLFKYNNTYQNRKKHYEQRRFVAIGVLGIPKRRDKVGFVLGSSVLNLYIRLSKSPTDAKPRDVSRYFRSKFR